MPYPIYLSLVLAISLHVFLFLLLPLIKQLLNISSSRLLSRERSFDFFYAVSNVANALNVSGRLVIVDADGWHEV